MPAPLTHKPAKSKRARIYGVMRLDNERLHTHAWQVRITRRRRTFSMHFTDGVHGGKGAALKAAIDYRDKILQDHAPLSRLEVVQVRRKDNRSGVPGVCRAAQPRSRKGKPHLEWFWVAGWTPRPGGAYKRAYFSVKEYGEKGAFKRAVAARRRGLAEMEPGAHIIHPGQVQRRGRGRTG